MRRMGVKGIQVTEPQRSRRGLQMARSRVRKRCGDMVPLSAIGKVNVLGRGDGNPADEQRLWPEHSPVLKQGEKALGTHANAHDSHVHAV